MTTKKKHFRVYLPTIIGGLIVLVIAVFIIRAISNIEDKPEKKERTIQKITLTKPPPPPPPPPKVEKPPEPEIEEQVEKAPEPEPEPEPLPDVAEPPPGDLGLDAEGSAGSDGFGLAARKGGKGLLGGGAGGDPFAWYGGIIKSDILEILSEHDALREKGYTAIIKLWLAPDGTVQRFELAKGSNDPDIDQLINTLLSKYRKVNEPLPPGMEQPVKLRITSRL